MVDEFSAFARMPQPVMQPVSMRELVAGQANLFETETLAVSVTAEPDDQPFTVFGDPGLLRQALTNLIQNAADSMADAGTPNPRIDLSLSINNGFVIISVADNGAGFPDMDLNQLLEPYVTKREKGTGLGLAIVSKIVEDHAGGLVLGSAGSAGSAGSEGGALVTMRIPMFDTQQEAKG
jgi:two-component system nitrogen regulation sensor histidine kinase NtrY